MNKLQFRILYREFLFRVVDLEILAEQGDITKLLGQFAALLLFLSLCLMLPTLTISSAGTAPEIGIVGAWTIEHFLISTTMLVAGLFAVMSWDSMFPDKRDMLVLSPLPVRATTLFSAKAAAVATALGVAVLALNGFTGLVAPIAFAGAPVAAPPTYDAAMTPLEAADMHGVIDHDLWKAFTAPDGALVQGNGAGAVVGIVKHRDRRVFAYGAARPDSIYEIGSISKTFTGLILANMVAEGRVRLDEPVRDLLPAGVAPKPTGAEITLLDLATHHSGLPSWPDNLDLSGEHPEFVLAAYQAPDLYAFLAKHGFQKPAAARFLYSNLGFGLIGESLARRSGTSYANLLAVEVTGPLGLRDTTIQLTPEQGERLIQAYDPKRKPVPAWNLGALSGAGGIRSTAGDMVTYLEAQLHPEELSNLMTLQTALANSHQLRTDADAGSRVALAWLFMPETGSYWHSGGLSGYRSFAFFNPKGDYAGVVLFNSATPAGFCDLLGEHIAQRFAGKPAVALTNVVIAGKGGVRGAARSFAAFWITVLAGGIFSFGLVLSTQGLAQLLPRQLFLRVSTFLQMGFFVLLLSVYFLQPGFSDMETLAGNPTTLGWLPSYWFFGLFQQLNGPLNPALAFLPQRAWIGLGCTVVGSVVAYLLCYLRTLRMIAEQPDIMSASSHFRWLPRFGGSFETAVGQFSVRSLLRSRQHRMLLAFYLGIAIALVLFFSSSPELRQQRKEDLWYQVHASLLVASVLMICASAVGTRMVFAMPLNPKANWLFRIMPIPPIQRCHTAIRRSLYALGVAPMWLAMGSFFFWVWPWRIAAGHIVILGLVGIIIAELWLAGFHKLPFTCSYQPGKSRFHMAVLIVLIFLFLLTRGASWERDALVHPASYAATVSALAVVAIVLRYWTKAQFPSEDAVLQFDDSPDPAVVVLGLR